MPGIAWVVLIKTVTPFFRSLYFVIFECEDDSTTRDESCAATINILHRSRTDREIMAPRCELAEPDLVHIARVTPWSMRRWSGIRRYTTKGRQFPRTKGWLTSQALPHALSRLSRAASDVQTEQHVFLLCIKNYRRSQSCQTTDEGASWGGFYLRRGTSTQV